MQPVAVRRIVVGTVLLMGTSVGHAQQATISTPFQRTGDSFSENIGVRWGVNFPGGFFRFNPPQGLGGPNAAGGLTTGFNVRRGNTNAFFNFGASQGSRRGIVSQTPSVTIPNGGAGGFFDGSVRPFVIGLVPTVGDAPQRPAWQQRLEQLRAAGTEIPSRRSASQPRTRVPRRTASSAELPAASVAAIRQAQAGQDAVATQAADEELEALIRRADLAVQRGRLGAARVYYQMAIRRADPPQRRQLQSKLQAISTHE